MAPGGGRGDGVLVSFIQHTGPGIVASRLNIGGKPLYFANDRAIIELRRGEPVDVHCVALGAPGSELALRCVIDGLSRKLIDRLTIAPDGHPATARVTLIP